MRRPLLITRLTLGLTLVALLQWGGAQRCPDVESHTSLDGGYYSVEGAELLRRAYTACPGFGFEAVSGINGLEIVIADNTRGAVAARFHNGFEWSRWRVFEPTWDADVGSALICLDEPAFAADVRLQNPTGSSFVRLYPLEAQDSESPHCRQAAPEARFFWEGSPFGWELWRSGGGAHEMEFVRAYPPASYAGRPLESPGGELTAIVLQEEYGELPLLAVFDSTGGQRLLTRAGSPLLPAGASWTDENRLDLRFSCGTGCVRAEAFSIDAAVEQGLRRPGSPEEEGGFALLGDLEQEDLGTPEPTILAAAGSSWYTYDPLLHDTYRARLRGIGPLGEIELVIDFRPEARGDAAEGARISYLSFEESASGVRCHSFAGTIKQMTIEANELGDRQFTGIVAAGLEPDPLALHRRASENWGSMAEAADGAHRRAGRNPTSGSATGTNVAGCRFARLQVEFDVIARYLQVALSE